MQEDENPSRREHPREELTARSAAALRRAGARAEDAELVARSLVSADARGIHSHGLLRLPLYLSAIEAGGIDPAARPTVLREAGATAVVDAGSGFGQVAVQEAVRIASRLAGRHGVSSVAVQRNTHYGAGAYWTEQLARAGTAAILASTTGASVAPYGSGTPLIGTNPITVSFPASERPITADLATSAGAYGRVVSAAASASELPEGWAIDGSGRPTTDARAVLEGGALAPFGGHKGSALAVLVELLAGAAGGGRFAHETVDLWQDPGSRVDTGALLIAIDLRVLRGDDEAERRATGFRERLTSLPPAPGFGRVLAPGDPEHLAEQENGERVMLPLHIDAMLRETLGEETS
ncbi:Ldh family oxidoreductase [Leucobacter sp. CSA1]|uniref:Ldh family oxidoreductase n=1 Tax=Leucobacter chromiisoli TaxID=2796471 RepID=A0A934UWZ6_9MICO|nr:Ldh family oxidoreductase [Leucobacter chromiisoli]MBK0420422.1 Ldh family oxidoreductase [Leucobacter chromiisoli]